MSESPDLSKGIHKGLEGVVADTTAVSLVDGEAGTTVLPRLSR